MSKHHAPPNIYMNVEYHICMKNPSNVNNLKVESSNNTGDEVTIPILLRKGLILYM